MIAAVLDSTCMKNAIIAENSYWIVLVLQVLWESDRKGKAE
jgi:hypothetical protein